MSFPEPEYIEASIYSGGFPSNRDRDLMQEFHKSSDVEHLVKISRNFEDDRFSIFAERIICTEYANDIPEDIRARYEDLIQERITTQGKWGSLEKSISETESLLEEETSDENIKILNATKEKLISMQKISD